MIRSRSPMYLYGRNNGRYHIGQRLDRKVVWRSTGEITRSAALIHLKEFSEEVARERYCDSLTEFSERFLAVAAQNMAPKTLDIYHRTFRLFGSLGGDCPLTKLTGEHWDRYKAERLRTIAPSSVNSVFNRDRFTIRMSGRYPTILVRIHPGWLSKFLQVLGTKIEQ